MLSPYYSTVRPDMIRYLPSDYTRVLEVGCSAGGFASHLTCNSVEVWGVEPFPAAAAEASRRLTRVLCGLYDQVSNDIPDRHFDLVICNDVIEHMPDHVAFLQDIKRKMRPGACLVGSLPNLRHITALIKILALKDFPYSDEGILDRTHLRFFTKKSIARTLKENGYALEELGGNSGVLRYGFCGMSRVPDLALRVVTMGLITMTGGYYADIQYPQFGFRARLLD